MAYLLAGFDIVRLGSMQVAVNDGTDSGTATVPQGKYCHRDITALSAKLGSGNYDDFATAVDGAIDAVLTTHSSGVSVALATGAYTLGTYNANTTLDFTSATLTDSSGKRLAAALGFNYNHSDATGGSATDPYNISLSGATSYVSNVTPKYYLALARDGITHTDGWPPYQVAGQTHHVTTTLGNGYGKGPSTKTEFCEIKLGFQTKASVFAQNADDTAAPWTYEDLVTHAGTWEPIVVSTTALEFVLKDRVGDFGKDQRRSVFDAFHAKWHIDLAGHFIGYL